MNVANFKSQSTAASAAATAAALTLARQTTKWTRAVKELWDFRTKRDENGLSPEQILEAQIDDVFLVLALLGEALVPLDIFDDSAYDSTLRDLESCMSVSEIPILPGKFAKLSKDLTYLCTAACAVCSVFAPLHVYRGFGACVYGDWDWGCPDFEYLKRKTRKASSVFAETPNPQLNKRVLHAFDRVIQVLQVKPLAFMSHRPSISGFLNLHPRYGQQPKKDVKNELSLCEDWAREIDKRGHPSLPETQISTWGMPWATWTSAFGCCLTKSFEPVMLQQMDPGRLLHAFLCRNSLQLHEGQVLTLPPSSAAETLICWLAGRPGMSHKIIGWGTFEAADFEKKVGKKMAKRLGRHPLPHQFAVRAPEAAEATGVPPQMSKVASFEASESASPPPYSAESFSRRLSSLDTASGASADVSQPTVAELPGRSPVELDSTQLSKETHSEASKERKQSSTSTKSLPLSSEVEHRPKSLTTIRRKPAPVARHTSAPLLDQSARTQGGGRSNSDAEATSPPPIPPKVPTESAVTIDAEQSNSPVFAAEMSRPSGASYLELLRAVASGEISPQNLQEILEAHTNPSASLPSESAKVITEPQELDSDPMPPKFMGVSIPRGETKPAQAAIREEIPSALRPGGSG